MALNRRRQFLTAALLVVLCYFWLATPFARNSKPEKDEAFYREKYPLLWKHVHLSSGHGGAWYIPPDWLNPSDPTPTTIHEAARLAYSRANELSRTIPYSGIPLIVHQSWSTRDIATWRPLLADCAEKWLGYAMAEGNEGMAYFLWLDEACDELVEQAEPDLLRAYNGVPVPVERFDICRIVVLKWFGGVYGDIDTIPLRSPASWIDETDISPWSDEETGATYSAASSHSSSTSRPVRILLGIEADTDPNADTYWRMGYNFPVQLTQWALASEPQHPILDRYLNTFAKRVEEVAAPYKGDLTAALGALKEEDPIMLTGPGAITIATKDWLKEKTGLRWNSVTGLKDGGRSKAIGGTVIFPITAFSPGRVRNGKMGSKPITDPDARLYHHAKGSWRKFDLQVEYGKFCRRVFGLCRDWSKVPR